MNDEYEVRNAVIENQLREIGATIAPTLPHGWGFALFLFSFGEGGSTFYISNANRSDMLRMLEEFQARQANNA